MVFGSLKNGKSDSNIFLGSPEAEAESLDSSRVKLVDVYQDLHDLFGQITYEKFIVIGRKGSGKSAFAQYAQAKAERSANLFVDFVKQDRVNLEQLVQIGREEGHMFEKESIFKWLIYTHLIRLFSSSEAAKESNEFEQLRQFLRKNSGFVDITESEMIEITQSRNFEVNLEPLKRFYRQKIKKDFSIKSHKAPFYKLIPNLEEIIVNVLSSKVEKDNDNSYVIFFDDLDVAFNVSDKTSVDSVVSLLRIAKAINMDFFDRNSIKAKVVILLRDDVDKYISDKYPDTGKLLTSYAARINWYQDDFNKISENDLNIKKFIDLRIKYAFDKLGLEANADDPWSSLVDTHDGYLKKSSFKYVLDHTLFRPRDLLLLFMPLDGVNFKLPLSKFALHGLIGKYSNQLVTEFKNEISSFYSQNEIAQLFSAIKKIHDDVDCKYKNALSYIKEYYTGDISHKEILEDLFDRSIIGNKYSSTNFKYKYREPVEKQEVYTLNENELIVMQVGFKAFFTNYTAS